MTLCRSVAAALLLGERVLHALFCEPDLLDEVQTESLLQWKRANIEDSVATSPSVLP